MWWKEEELVRLREESGWSKLTWLVLCQVGSTRSDTSTWRWTMLYAYLVSFSGDGGSLILDPVAFECPHDLHRKMEQKVARP